MDEEYRFPAPGRVEIGGNHTDHQHGRVLAAAINLESKAIVRRNCEGKIRVISEGYDPVEIDVSGILGCTRRRRTPPRR